MQPLKITEETLERMRHVYREVAEIAKDLLWRQCCALPAHSTLPTNCNDWEAVDRQMANIVDVMRTMCASHMHESLKLVISGTSVLQMTSQQRTNMLVTESVTKACMMVLDIHFEIITHYGRNPTADMHYQRIYSECQDRVSKCLVHLATVESASEFLMAMELGTPETLNEVFEHGKRRHKTASGETLQ